MKFCVNCKWHKSDISVNKALPARVWRQCDSPNNVRVDMVTGKHGRRYTCEEMRNESGGVGCGYSGAWFQPKGTE